MVFKRSKEGYLLIDNRESPGVPLELALQAEKRGKPVPLAQGGKLYECATLTCAHCNRVVILNPDRKRPRGYCSKCDSYVCDNPGCGLECTPFKKFIDDALDQASRVQS